MSDASNESATSPEGPRQFEVPRRIPIIQWLGGAGSDTQQDVYVRLTTPDARLIQKLTLLASAVGTAPASTVLAGRNLTLWLYTEEKDEGRGKKMVPVTDLAGSTSAAPIALPANANLGGFSREFVTTADAIGGRIRIPAQAPGGVQGTLFLQARFQPNAFRLMPWAEWQEVRSQCKIELVGRSGPIVIP